MLTIYEILRLRIFLSSVMKSRRNAVLVCLIYFYHPLPLINKYLLSIMVVARTHFDLPYRSDVV